jgi:stress response protein SCP2
VHGAVTHSGDCKRGKKKGLDEVIKISLDEVKGVNVIMFVINAFSGGTLEKCESAYCEIKHSGKVLATMSATCAQTGNSTALLMCALFRHPDTLNWHYTSVREAATGRHFSACMVPIRAVVDKLIDPGARGERNLSMDKSFEMGKGDQVVIPKNVTKLVVGLGWTAKSEGLDLDASCIMLGAPFADKQVRPVDVCYFKQKECHGVRSAGDNRTGAGDGDDERLIINLDKVDKYVDALAIVVTLFTLNRTFDEIKNSYVRLMDESGAHVFAKYSLTGELTQNALVFCQLVRGATVNDPWTFIAVGEQCTGRSAPMVKSLLWEGTAKDIDKEAIMASVAFDASLEGEAALNPHPEEQHHIGYAEVAAAPGCCIVS